ncbi:hypothetical protein [Thermogemmatispora sp.]|uniref:hypothetical protein n=1 Tax=Thermogemmatispora sp. TaxID=1968838 RepID=UPI001D4DC2C3|nr:hypothetical protein [Thermogemmatispora sp.]MBX5449949.1 hypothetical protein [Thermogemmatispora sp.]
MSSHATPGAGNGAAASGSSFSHRREGRIANGASPALASQSAGGRGPAGAAFDLNGLIAELRALFERDRQIASLPDSTRCGICYLHYRLSELRWREEGFYICRECERLLGEQPMPMLRKQQRQG